MINRYPYRILTLVHAIALTAFILGGCAKEETQVKKEKGPVPVTVGEASTRRVTYVLNQVGTLKASQEVMIRSEIEGKVISILFKEGQKVRKGEILVKLDPTKIQAEIRNLEARIHQLEIRLNNKDRTLDRYRPLAKKGVVAGQQFDNLQSETDEIRAQIIQAKADLSRQEEVLSYTTIRAPFDGIAGHRKFSVGHYLKVGEPMVSIVALDPLEITFQAPERSKSRLSIGQDVLLSVDAHPGRTFKGEVFFISPEVETDTRSFEVKARVMNNRPILNPGMFAKVEVILEVHNNAVTIPWESVIQTEQETYIYVVEGGMARKVPVRTGKVTSEWAEIVDPVLSPGTSVILEGKFAVKDRAKVTKKVDMRPEKAEKP